MSEPVYSAEGPRVMRSGGYLVHDFGGGGNITPNRAAQDYAAWCNKQHVEAEAGLHTNSLLSAGQSENE